ncbi:hypothetical protein F5B22DRAFT_644285 [Xylaria bambusicola]|uniref:uncharacterized protein n=1 Tax=Xylaria bambusicola TaxID=326684 RepID=UPI0020071F32|nr:uncharacterized protein F5B22DRAFT_644285 [Xylaria bambusicola]KAI0521041.1 hypothetical protein F5B22DRAFT_644285 [Xylaria bambusicola]
MVADHDDDPLPVTTQLAIELSVVVELGNVVHDKLVCVVLEVIFVPVSEAELVQLEITPVDVLLELVMVDIDAVLTPDDTEPPVEGIAVPIPELGCQLIGVGALEAETEADPRLDEGILVSLHDESLEVVTVPDSKLELDITVDELPVIGDAVFIVVVFQGVPGVPLDVAVTVLEFHKLVELTVPPLVSDISLLVALPLTELEIIVIVEVTVGLFVSVLVTVLKVHEFEDVSVPLAGSVLIVVLPLGPGRPPWGMVVDKVSVVSVPALPDEPPVLKVLAVLEIIGTVLLPVGVVELDQVSLPLLDAPVSVDTADLVSLPKDHEKVLDMMEVEVPGTVQLRAVEVIIILDDPSEEGPPDPLMVGMPEPDRPDDTTVDVLPLVTEGVAGVVPSVVVESLHEGVPDDKETF